MRSLSLNKKQATRVDSGRGEQLRDVRVLDVLQRDLLTSKPEGRAQIPTEAQCLVKAARERDRRLVVNFLGHPDRTAHRTSDRPGERLAEAGTEYDAGDVVLEGGEQIL